MSSASSAATKSRRVVSRTHVSSYSHSRANWRAAYENIEIVTRSHPDAFPSPLRQKGKTQTKVHEADDALLKVTEKCPECGHMEAFSREMQVRRRSTRRRAVGLKDTCSCAVQTKAQPYSIL